MTNITHLLGEIKDIDETLKVHKLSKQDYEEIVEKMSIMLHGNIAHSIHNFESK